MPHALSNGKTKTSALTHGRMFFASSRCISTSIAASWLTSAMRSSARSAFAARSRRNSSRPAYYMSMGFAVPAEHRRRDGAARAAAVCARRRRRISDDGRRNLHRRPARPQPDRAHFEQRRLRHDAEDPRRLLQRESRSGTTAKSANSSAAARPEQSRPKASWMQRSAMPAPLRMCGSLRFACRAKMRVGN